MSYTRVGPGIYRDSRTGNLYERPTINGKKTWRKLHSLTVKLAAKELAARRTDQARAVQGLAADPYKPKSKTIADLCSAFIEARCPDRSLCPRAGRMLDHEQFRIKKLLPFWSSKLAALVKTKDCADYYAWRKRRIKRGDGGRAIDLELSTLSNVLQWAVAMGKAESNPLAFGRPRFRNTKAVRHCREFMPLDGNELHELARSFFQDKRSEVLGWQLLLEAMTGCRTSEVLQLRWDAAGRHHPGFIENDWLWIVRSKGGVKPFVTIHPALRDCLDAMKRWHAWRFPRSPWWFPSYRVKGQPIDRGSLGHGLSKIDGPHRTSHGLRAFYVTVRRCQGISDAQIAYEIGDKSGAAIVVSTYGAVPPNWRGNEAMSWMPTKGEPAWTVLKVPENIVASGVFRRVFASIAKL